MSDDQATMKKQLAKLMASMAHLTEAVRALAPAVVPQAGVAAGPQPTVATSHTSTILPNFDGSDPLGWLARANQQFKIHNTPSAQNVPSAMVAMERDALYWFTWIRQRKLDITWDKLSRALVVRFDTRYKGNPFERLSDVKQTGSVNENVNLFVQLASQVPGLSDEHYMGYFLSGLVDNIRSKLRMLRPKDLETAMKLAWYVEEDLQLQAGERMMRSFITGFSHP